MISSYTSTYIANPFHNPNIPTIQVKQGADQSGRSGKPLQMRLSDPVCPCPHPVETRRGQPVVDVETSIPHVPPVACLCPDPDPVDPIWWRWQNTCKCCVFIFICSLRGAF